MEYLIPILMFLFPLLVAILDKQVKKRKGVPPVKARPVFPPAEGSGRGPAQQDVFRGYPRDRFPQEGNLNNEPVIEEGQRAISKKAQAPAASTGTGEEKPKLEIDKKKLILYSEILKPKYDSGLRD